MGCENHPRAVQRAGGASHGAWELLGTGRAGAAAEATGGQARASELERAERFFARYGAVTVFICRLLPVVRTFIAFPAGLARMPMLKFQIYTFVGSWPWCFGLAYVGVALGARWDSDPELRRLFHESDALILLVLIAGFAWFVWSRWRETHSGRR